MIYLIDDKKYRQIDFGWNQNKFKEQKDFIKTIYDYDTIVDDTLSVEIFDKRNVVLFHESFFENPINDEFIKNADEVRDKLLFWASNSPDFKVVFFGGSKSTRKLENNIAHVPVSVLYQNLSVFVDQYKLGNSDLRYLLFGKNYEIEEGLSDALETANKKIIGDDFHIDIDDTDTILLRPEERQIPKVLKNANYRTLYLEEQFDFDVTDTYLSEKILDWFDEIKYKNIFIPLCFGSTLSDFNGIRLATHIRCSDTPNRLSNIFIYGIVGFEKLIKSKYFDILKTKNIFLIKYSKKAFQETLLKDLPILTDDELPSEINKIKLNLPKNYDSNHSLANEWAIYKWTYTLPKPLYSKVDKILDRFETDLYFKYLQTIFPISKFIPVKENQLTIEYKENAKILFIDNDYRKGWFDIFKYILEETNGKEVDFLELDFRKVGRETIVNESVNKIIDFEKNKIKYDVVILDFRLHPSDSIEKDLKLITGMQILNRIKHHNKGVQVIVFSATNKIWNLQAIQEAGADAFLIKEGPENSFDTEFTYQCIIDMVKKLNSCLNRSFLKEIYSNLIPLIKEVKFNATKKPKNYNLNIPQGKILEYEDFLAAADFLLYSNPNDLRYCFLQLILIIEDIVKFFYIDSSDGNHYVKWSLNEPILCIDNSGLLTRLKLSPINRWNEYFHKDYVIENDYEKKLFNAKADSIPFNYRLNCLLFFKYNIDLKQSSEYSSLYTLRSNSVAHMGNSEVKDDDIIKAIKLLTLLIE